MLPRPTSTIEENIPGYGELEINTIVLDLNGTLAIDGKLIKGVRDRINALQGQGMQLLLFSGDTNGNAAKIAKKLNVEVKITSDALSKAREAKKLNLDTTAAIGNGAIDLEIFKSVRLSILTLQQEGVKTETLLASDIVVFSINDALDLFLKPNRLRSTLRK